MGVSRIPVSWNSTIVWVGAKVMNVMKKIIVTGMLVNPDCGGVGAV